MDNSGSEGDNNNYNSVNTDKQYIQTQQLKLSRVYLSFFVGGSPTPPSSYRIAAKKKVRCPLNLSGEDLSSLFSLLFSHILHFLKAQISVTFSQFPKMAFQGFLLFLRRIF